MRIRIWNAFASNNSGSYVIVGRFPRGERAVRFADELRAVVAAESTWRMEAAHVAPSPLAAYAARHGIGEITWDDWPYFSDMPHPAVWAAGNQVFVYSDYTSDMPATLGHLMYVHGGRVETELVHTHHPIAATFAIYADDDALARVQAIVNALAGPGGALTTLEMHHPPAWRGRSDPDEHPDPDLVLGACFDDICAGFTAVATACAAVDTKLDVRVAECIEGVDPFAHLRPSSPAPT